MTCPAVRDRLPEFALALLPPREREVVERHVVWCAACRKEADALEEAGSVLAFAAAPADPPPELQARVARAVGNAAARGPTTRRRVRLAGVAAALATVVALSGLGWGAVMADRAGEAERRADRAEQLRLEAEAFRTLVADQFVSGPRDRLLFAQLVSRTGGASTGWGFAMVSPDQPDVVGVNLVALPADVTTPVRVLLTGKGAKPMLVARIRHVDGSGAIEQFRRLDADLSGGTAIVVADANGRTLVSGPLGGGED